MADAEERFLKARLEREATRASKAKDEAAIEATKAREQLNTDVKGLESNIKSLLSEGKVDEASEKCRVLQQIITSANEMLTLPSHEQRSLNTILSTLTSSISDAKAGQKPIKKFGFSSKARLVSTAVAVAEDAEKGTDLSSKESGKEESASGEVIADLEKQTIFVPSVKAVFIRRCTDCLIFALPTEGSLFLSDCKGCTVYCAPHQLRIKSCQNMALYTWCTSRPVIESCDEMRFGGYDAWSGLLASSGPAGTLSTHEEWVSKVGGFKDLAWARNSFTQVDDFHWLRQTQSPHWSLIPESEWVRSDVLYVTTA